MADYTRFESKEMSEVLSLYGLSLESSTPMNGGMANSSFLVNGSYVLTALDNHDLQSAERLVQTMQHMSGHGVFTPQPIRSQNGLCVEVFKGRPIIVKPYLDTRVPPTGEQERAPLVGALLARIHAAPTPSFLGSLGRRIPADALDVLEGHACNDLKDAIRRVQNPEFDHLLATYPVAICHGDLMGDNILETPEGGLVPIDWETATLDAIVLDIGIAGVTAVKQGLNVLSYLNAIVTGYGVSRSSRTIELSQAVQATSYACVLMSYHRYLRQNIRFPSAARAHIYKELLEFVLIDAP